MPSPVSSIRDVFELDVLELNVLELDIVELDIVEDVVAAHSNLDTAQCSTMLVQGDSGTDVMELQRLLLQWSAFSGYGYRGTETLDDQFNCAVRKAVETFQAAMFLQPDGVVGALTWRSLYSGAPVIMPTLQRGDCGTDVSRLQRILIITSNLSPNHIISNTYDLATEVAVRQAQAQAGLTPTGIADSETWRALSRAIAYSRIVNTPNQ